jgi:hypothetical protein
MMRGYDIYDRFTMEYFSLRQSMILTTSFFCSRQYILGNFYSVGTILTILCCYVTVLDFARSVFFCDLLVGGQDHAYPFRNARNPEDAVQRLQWFVHYEISFEPTFPADLPC